MLKYFFVVITVTQLFGCDQVISIVENPCSGNNKIDLVGSWKGTDSIGKKGSFLFLSDCTFSMTAGDTSFDSKAIGADMTWRLDVSQHPIQLDLILKKPTKESLVMPYIVREISNNKVEIASFRGDYGYIGRPSNFLESNASSFKQLQMILVKQ